MIIKLLLGQIISEDCLCIGDSLLTLYGLLEFIRKKKSQHDINIKYSYKCTQITIILGVCIRIYQQKQNKDDLMLLRL